MEAPIMGLPDQKGPAPVAAWGMTAEDGPYKKTKKKPKTRVWIFAEYSNYQIDQDVSR
jgi:hypothetical protein